MKKSFFSILSLVISCNCFAQKNTSSKTIDVLKNESAANIQSGYDAYKKIALSIWDYAELGYKENKSSALLQNTLKENGFTVEAGVAGMPTAFAATYGSGSPVIAILAEYDALPGLSQDNSPVKTAIANKSSAHACGHHLFGTGSVAAGIAVKKLLEAGKIKGTIKVFGCPAEEGGSGKVYMVREGLFTGVDIVLHWHPSERSSADRV
jgi:aminobenzoyl-glutamate utilization protein B